MIILEEFIIERLVSVDSAEENLGLGDTNLNKMDDEVEDDED